MTPPRSLWPVHRTMAVAAALRREAQTRTNQEDTAPMTSTESPLTIDAAVKKALDTFGAQYTRPEFLELTVSHEAPGRPATSGMLHAEIAKAAATKTPKVDTRSLRCELKWATPTQATFIVAGLWPAETKT